MDHYYITTAIDYPNGTPHLGHAYEKVVTDFYARWHKLMGEEVYFLTGTDENGQKLMESAKAEGLSPQDFVNQQVQGFHKLCADLKLSHNDFIRTTQQRHIKVAQSFWKKLQEKELIYFDHYTGFYCLSCESFYTESQTKEEKLCPHHHTPLEKKDEAGYFFKLSSFQKWLLSHFKEVSDFVIPSSSRKEILSRLEKEPLRDLAISRPSQGWGIPVPGDEKFVMYTWFDALINYYSALEDQNLIEKFWPASVHVIGKDIVWFHSVIWPAMLKALELPLPEKIYVHGMVLAADGKKMSKSLGNGVNPQDIMSQYPLESFRFYLLKAISAHADGPFSEAELINTHNNELANDFGNLLMRVAKFALKKDLSPLAGSGSQNELPFADARMAIEKAVHGYEHHKAIELIWEQVRAGNQYINEKAPWKIKEDPQRLREVLYNALHLVHQVSFLLQAAMPEAMKKVFSYLGVSDQDPKDSFGKVTYQLVEPEPLFPKIV